MKYPRMDPEKWANAKTTLKEREEIKQYIQNGWSAKAVAEMYGVSMQTVKYWGDDEFRAKDNERCNKRKKRKMENPEYAKKIAHNRKVRTDKRRQTDPEYNNWVKNGWKENYNYNGRTDEKIAHDKITQKQYYQTHKEEARARCRRSYRARDFNGFRMFIKHINNEYNLDNICYKTETKSTSSYKREDVQDIRSHLKTVKPSLTIRQRIREKLLIPIHALKRVRFR